jgi:hypothetical protein
MRKTTIALAMIGTMIAQVGFARPGGPWDPTDLLNQLAYRDGMVKAVAILSILPPKCTIDQKPVSGESIARFIISYGHKGDDAFLAAVKAQIKRNEEIFKIPDPDQAKFLEFVCAFGVLLTAKVRDAGNAR